MVSRSCFQKTVLSLLLAGVIVGIYFLVAGNSSGTSDDNSASLVGLNNECEDLLNGKYLVSRLWRMKEGSNWTTYEVVDSFQSGFAPTVQRLDGFVQYIGSDSEEVEYIENAFFFNIFDTEEKALEAQAAAVEYQQSLLTEAIEEEIHVEGQIDFYTATACSFTQDYSISHVAARVWTSNDESLTGQDIVDAFRTGFRSTISQADGFEMYIGVVIDESQALFLNIFDTLENANLANFEAAMFIESHPELSGKASVEPYAGVVHFDYNNLPNECSNQYQGDFTIARLWNMAEPLGEVEDPTGVVTAFEDGFAPIVENLPGFDRYVGTYGDSTGSYATNSFFFNMFDTEANGLVAQQAAVDFVDSHPELSNSIVAQTFVEGTVDFSEAQSCTSLHYDDLHLAARIWTVNPEFVGNITGQDIVDEFRRGFLQTIKKEDGFEFYMGVVVDDNHALFVNVFSYLAGADQANEDAAAFIAAGILNGTCDVEPYSGIIGFDFSTY